MRKLLCLLAILFSIEMNAQNYLVSFAASGEAALVEQVRIENLRSGAIVTMNGSDILRLNVVTGLNMTPAGIKKRLTIYPNPSDGNFRVSFPDSPGSKAILDICDLSGSRLFSQSITMHTEGQEISVSGLKAGFYIIGIRINGNYYSGCLVSNGLVSDETEISVTEGTIDAKEKSSEIEGKGAMDYVDMAFSSGDRLKFTATTGSLSTVLVDSPSGNKTVTFDFITCRDGDNNNYAVIRIGTQIWMGTNLRATRYSDGTAIQFVNSPSAWDNLTSSDKAYCSMNDDIDISSAYGFLYTWAAAVRGNTGSAQTTGNIQGVCPSGWHVPANGEWAALIEFLGGNSLAGRKIKETGTIHWMTPNNEATNESGFTGLPGGIREQWAFNGFRIYGSWWSSTENSSSDAFSRSVDGQFSTVYNYKVPRKYGNSVRCVKD